MARAKDEPKPSARSESAVKSELDARVRARWQVGSSKEKANGLLTHVRQDLDFDERPQVRYPC